MSFSAIADGTILYILCGILGLGVLCIRCYFTAQKFSIDQTKTIRNLKDLDITRKFLVYSWCCLNELAERLGLAMGVPNSNVNNNNVRYSPLNVWLVPISFLYYTIYDNIFLSPMSRLQPIYETATKLVGSKDDQLATGTSSVTATLETESEKLSKGCQNLLFAEKPPRSSSHTRYHGKNQWPNVPPWLFGMSSFIARIPGVLADTGSDFSNNLLSDLAPILTLFGEQVTKQYMSQSMTWAENLIFALGPLGAITAVVSAIRVGGPRQFKALIGRAREADGVVELELMSSTSNDVCELWNGKGVVRVLGQSPIMEYYYLQPSSTSQNLNNETYNSMNSGIYSFSSAISSNSCKPRPLLSPRPNTTMNTTVPNIPLNIGGQKVSDVELRVVVLIGLTLQLGVILFAGVSVFSTSKYRFQNDGKVIRPYAFPLMATGTVALAIGMFICAYIIDRSTTEITWDIHKPEGFDLHVAWLQRRSTVSDQEFGSFIIPRIEKPVPSWKVNLLGMDSNPCIKTSQKNGDLRQAPLTVIATSISFVGFLLQFVGLRGLNWSITICQLSVTLVMTILRALVRRNLVHDVQTKPVEDGYELEVMAKKIKRCCHWGVVASSSPEDQIRTGLATEVVNARFQLKILSAWECQWKHAVNSTAEAIEATMTLLCTSMDISRFSDFKEKEFEWELTIEVASESEISPVNTPPQVFQMGMNREWLSDGRGWGDWKVDKKKVEAVIGLWMLQLEPQKYQNSTLETHHYRFVNTEKKTYDEWIRRQGNTLLSEDVEKISTSHQIIGKPSNFGDQHLVVLSDAPLEEICGQYILSAFISGFAKTVLRSIGGSVRARGGQHAAKASFSLRSSVLDEIAHLVNKAGLATVEDAFLSIVPPLKRENKLPDSDVTTVEFKDMAKEIKIYFEGKQFEQAEQLLLWILDTTEDFALNLAIEGKREDALELYQELCSTYRDIKGAEDYVIKAQDSMNLFTARQHKEETTSQNETKISDTADLDLDFRDSLGRSNLTLASMEGNQIRVARLLRRGSAIDVLDRNGWTAIHYASKNGYNLILHMLLLRVNKDSRIINMRGPGKESALELAIDNNNGSAVALLVFYGATDEDNTAKLLLSSSIQRGSPAAFGINPNKMLDNSDGRTPLHWSIWRDSETALNLILVGAGDNKVDLDAVDEKGRTALYYAACKGRMKMMELLFMKGANGECTDKFGWGALHAAVGNGHREIVKYLLDKNVTADTKDEQGRTPLSYAVVLGNESVVKLLLSRDGVVIDSKDNKGRTPLSYAAESENVTILSLLIKREDVKVDSKDDKGRTPLSYAAASGHQTIIKLLLMRDDVVAYSKDKHGRAPEFYATENGHANMFKSLLVSDDVAAYLKTDQGRTLLSRAAEDGHEDVVQELLARQVAADSKDDKGRTPLSYAAEIGNERIVQLLLTREDVTPDSSDENGRTPLSYAAGNGKDGVLQLLLVRGVAADFSDEKGRTPLSYAAGNGKDGVLQLLLVRGVAADCSDEKGRTPLSYAVENGHKRVVELLISEKNAVCTDSKDELGRTALSYAAEHGYEQILTLLLKKHITVDSKDKRDRTPLSYAAENGNEAIVKLLLARDVDVNSANSDGRTPLAYAASSNNKEIVKLLLSRDEIVFNSTDKYGLTPLLSAAIENNDTVFKMLLARQDTDIGIGSKGCELTALLLTAVALGQEEIVKLLLSRNEVNINRKDEEGATPLLSAAVVGNEAIFRLLLSRDDIELNLQDKYGRKPLSCAAGATESEGIVKLLLSRTDVDVNWKDDYGSTPLLTAVAAGNEAVIKLLLSRNDVGVNLGDNQGSTPLLSAAAVGNKAIVKLLLTRNDVKVNLKNRLGHTAQSKAKINGHKEIFDLLNNFMPP